MEERGKKLKSVGVLLEKQWAERAGDREKVNETKSTWRAQQ